MSIIYFFYGLSFGGLGLAAYLQLRRGGDFPLRKLLPWLAAFGFSAGAVAWVEMFVLSETNADVLRLLVIARIILQPLSGLLLLIFGWGMLARLNPLPSWAIFIPGILIVPAAYIITYALSTFVTPSPLEIPIDIWSRYLLYLPGSVMAGAGFMRQWHMQRRLGFPDVASLMLGAGIAFLFEAFVMGLVVPAAPYGPASYYNYDRVIHNAFASEGAGAVQPYGLTAWLDYQVVLTITGLPIQFWRMLSAFAVTFFVVRGLDVFEAIQRRQLLHLQAERDQAQQDAFAAQIAARQTAESWTDALVSISSRIAELQDVDHILLYIVESARKLLGSDFMGLALLDNEQGGLALKCYALEDRTETVNTAIPVKNLLILRALHSQPAISSALDEPLEALEGACFFTGLPANAVAVVRLALDGQPVGALWVACHECRQFSDTDLIWLECLADQVVIAVKHGLMTSQMQSISVSEERARIAREMHDGLAQVLGYLNLQVQTLDAYLQQGKLEKVQVKLAQMREAVQTAHADVRENILSLRTTLANEKGVVQAVAEYLQEFGIQTGIETEFDCQVDGELGLASIAEVQMVCILQEALTNVRKHARAGAVQVTLLRQAWGESQGVMLLVRDNGVGFAGGSKKGSFGLQTMRERAASVGGELTLSSVLEQGVEIRCFIPALRQEQLPRHSLILQ